MPPCLPSLYRVYPRTHGEATPEVADCDDYGGLSPHTRGSLGPPARGGVADGSIPAHTGKPAVSCWRCARWRVYPRTHGEAGDCHYCGHHFPGLSPHTRGSPSLPLEAWSEYGSIPAHTGKPSPRPRRPAPARVYPRTHGEARDGVLREVVDSGLSPHTRGSLPDAFPEPDRQGSIPAHTGKPGTPAIASSLSRVYPRTHGEAAIAGAPRRETLGLSPHTRGSHSHHASASSIVGSIPAHTGKPSRRRATRPRRAVYPRTHGEAACRGSRTVAAAGLSPHTRGSLRVTCASCGA